MLLIGSFSRTIHGESRFDRPEQTPRAPSFVAPIEISFVRWVIRVAVSFESGAYTRNAGLIGRRKNDDRLERGLGVFIGIRNAVESATAAPVVRLKRYELFSRNCRKYQPAVYIATLCINVHVHPTSSFPCLRSCVSIVNVARRTHRTRKTTLFLIAIQEFGNLRDEFPSLTRARTTLFRVFKALQFGSFVLCNDFESSQVRIIASCGFLSVKLSIERNYLRGRDTFFPSPY